MPLVDEVQLCVLPLLLLVGKEEQNVVRRIG
jgi:hypothetical protein